ncbi:MAG: 4-hydroxyproline epimerase [Gammaproteobacteria bacterium]|nr:MAG: 4-hydroxyproline epimerase [Gammaproteobacteria bacterium]
MKVPVATTFHCIDAHTCGNPVRVVVSGAPVLEGETMLDKREHFLREYDWIRTSLMYEPRGHSMMSGSMLYPTNRPDCDIGVLYIETSGCLAMCGHGAIGTVTIAIEKGLVKPRVKGELHLETPAGKVVASFTEQDGRVKSVTLTNVPAYLHAQDLSVECPELGGELKVDVAYGGAYYAIVEPQAHYRDLEDLSANDILRISPRLRERLNRQYSFVHPEDPRICSLTHIEWTGKPKKPDSDARNAVFYGDQAIDRSPCGTGTSARMAQMSARGKLATGERFVHESYIGSQFTGWIEAATRVGDYAAIIPSIEGWARIYGENTISVDPQDDPYWQGFLVT